LLEEVCHRPSLQEKETDRVATTIEVSVCNFEKLLASIILERIRRRTDQILNEAQAGSRGGRSIDQLLTLRRMSELYSEYGKLLRGFQEGLR